MPSLDFALIAEHVRVEQDLAYLIAGGTDMITTPKLPVGINLGLLLRVSFERAECGRLHRVEVMVQDEDGERLIHLAATGTPTWQEEWPINWKSKDMFGFNFGLPVARYGIHEFVILINDTQVKTIPFVVADGPSSSAAPSNNPQ